MPKPRIILDCDPGHDDAIALMMAARYAELLGITTVSGNVSLEKTTRNALIVSELVGMGAPVHAGAARPLLAEATHAEHIHGASGLGGPDLPALSREPDSHDAVNFIIDTVRQEESVWLVAVGPLTNLALALRTAPDIATKVEGISLMGGSTCSGNITPAAEFNIWADPEAAEIVFGCGAPILMSGLNLTHQFVLDQRAKTQVQELDNRAGRFVSELLSFFGDTYARLYDGMSEGPLHDPCALLAVTHPELFEFLPRSVQVETTGRHTRGMTVVDERGLQGAEPSNTQVGYRIDADRALELLLEALRHLP